MKIKNKTELKDVLYHENYDKIVIWEDGSWAEVSTSYAGEQSGDNPVVSIRRVNNYDMTRRKVNELIKETELELDMAITSLKLRKEEFDNFEYND